jgi:HSP20 family protein
MSNLNLWREFERPFAGIGAWHPLLRQLDDFLGDSAPKADFDYEEAPDKFVLSFDVPGAEKEQLHVELLKNQLSVTADRKRRGSYKHVVKLPEGIDAQGIEANYLNGVLTIVVPKVAPPSARKIVIGDGKPDVPAAAAS